MTWYKKSEELPPCDGVYEIGEISYIGIIKDKIRRVGFASYNGLEFSAHSYADYWRFPVVENVEKKYGKVK